MKAKKPDQTDNAQAEKLEKLLDHYTKGSEDMDSRMTRKNGWNDVIRAYLGQLPANWPYNSVVTDPRIRTTIVEKNGRLLNSKLQGRLIPREGGDVLKARINNAILDFQWDTATENGTMVEKIAMADHTTRLFGAAFGLVYWDNKKNSNEFKMLDPRDVIIDFGTNHIRSAKWAQVREFTTLEALKDRGYDVGGLKDSIKSGTTIDQRSSSYSSVIKSVRQLEDRVGNDLSNPTIEVVTEYTDDTVTLFSPKHSTIFHEGKNPYKHGRIPIAQLRYYPLVDDLYGESEVEPVIPLWRAINAVLCGYLDEMNLSMRPPLKIMSGQARINTIEYGPGAKWIMNNPNAVTEAQLGGQSIANFNATYPALVAAFNNAMGDQSAGISNVKGYNTDKTATEVSQMERQQNSRDQYNQLYLSEFLKDIMLMWLSNNKQYLFDDPKKTHIVYKIIGRDNIKLFQQMKLDETDIPPEAMSQISDTIMQNPGAVTPEMLQGIVSDVSVPTNPIVTNPDETDPENYDIKRKLDIKNAEEADLYVTKDDMDGEYDYIPDVKSMASGAGVAMQTARQKVMDTVLRPEVQAMLQTQGESVNIKDILVSSFEDAGYRDAESLFTKSNIGGAATPQPGSPGAGALGIPGMAGGPTAQAAGAGPIGVPNPAILQAGAGQAPTL